MDSRRALTLVLQLLEPMATALLGVALALELLEEHRTKAWVFRQTDLQMGVRKVELVLAATVAEPLALALVLAATVAEPLALALVPAATVAEPLAATPVVQSLPGQLHMQHSRPPNEMAGC